MLPRFTLLFLILLGAGQCSTPYNASETAAATSDRPPQAEPGKCYGKALDPATGTAGWLEIVCGDKLKPAILERLKSRLTEEGFECSKGAVWDASAKKALTDYQKKNGLPVGAIDLKTVEKLGVKY